MSTALGLAMQISANTAQLATAVQDVNKRLDDMSGAGKKAAKDLSVLKNIEIARAFIEGITLVANGLVSAASSARQLFNDSRDAIDQIGKLSTSTGVSVETIQKLQGVARLAGVESDQLAKALSKLGVQADKLKDKDDNVFERLGLDASELANSDIETILFQVAEAFSKIGNDTERIGIASELFGERIGRSLVPLLTQGGAALESALERAGRLGGVLTEDQVRLVERMNDRFSEVSSTIGGIINQITAGLAGPLEEAAQFLLDTFERVGGQEIGAVIADKLLQFVEVFAETFRGVAKFLADFLEQLRQLVNNIPGVNLETDADKERQRLEARAGRDAELRGKIAEIQAGIAKNLENIQRGGTGGLFGQTVQQSELEVARLRGRLERRQQDLAIEGLSERNAQRLQELRSGATAVSDTIDAAVDSITERVRQARERIAEQRADLAQPRVEEAQAQVDGVAQSVEESNQEVVEATEENTAEIRGLRNDIRNNQGEVVEIAG